jgi:uncharacterized repeat protein (TIGR01451 family)
MLPCLLSCTVTTAPVVAATPAGTRIANTATMTSGPTGSRVTQSSNTTVLTTDELLDVAIVAQSATVPVAATAASVAIPFLVTNQSNGAEAYRITATLVGAGTTVRGVALDVDNNGTYDATIDTMVDTSRIATTAGQQRRIFVLVDVPANLAADVTVGASATATTGSGAPGTVFAGQGDGGSDAVVGKTGATASAQSVLHPGAVLPTLIKSQSVLAPDGSGRVMHGSTVTYTLEAHFPAANSGVEIDDAIPASTTYVPGSLTLDDQPLSDASDGDAGSFDGTAVHVAIGNVAAAVVRTIRFKTIIQ